MLPDWHGNIVGYDVNHELLSAAGSDLVLTFSSQVLSPKSGISGSGEFEAAARVFTDRMGAILAREKTPVREGLPALDAKQAKPGHIP